MGHFLLLYRSIIGLNLEYMKVILLRDVARLGKRFSVAEVPDGYALNQLIPKGMAEAATPENLKRVNARTDKQVSNKVNSEAEFAVALSALKAMPLSITVQANAQGHLFKAVKAADIAAAAAATGHGIPLDSIALIDPIKSVGDHTVVAKMGAVAGEFILTIISK
jgi:large subunit ribosomal protein L9